MLIFTQKGRYHRIMSIIIGILILVKCSKLKNEKNTILYNSLKSLTIIETFLTVCEAIFALTTIVASFSVAIEGGDGSLFDFFVYGTATMIVIIFPVAVTVFAVVACIKGFRTCKAYENAGYTSQPVYTQTINRNNNITRSIKTCSVCGTASPMNKLVCDKCGSTTFMSVNQILTSQSRTTERETVNNNSRISYPDYENPNATVAPFTPATPAQQYNSQPLQTPKPVTDNSKPQGGKWRCSCGKRNSADSSFCPNCGKNRNSGSGFEGYIN